ncbi:MAG: xanthine dehydrogenase family protein subunit M [Chloroflexi bacterium]|nr:xanthine dehydrogenase family protein subunit M [Chloroflexota bacterium]
MRSFKYYAATSWEDAVAMLSKNAAAQVIAGGSDLLGWIKDDLNGPGAPRADLLIDIRTIPNTSYVKFDAAGGLKLGALTPLVTVAESADVLKNYPGLAKSALSPASPAIRNVGSIAGNLMQRPRCWYLRGKDFACYKKGGDFCFAVTGENQYHAILEGELCYIVHPSDTAPALIALNASAKVVGPGGAKDVALDKFFIGPRTNVLKETVLEHNELLAEISVPAPAANWKSAFIKVTQRDVYDFAVVSVAVAGQIEGGVWKDGRVVLGGVAPTPYRATAAEDALKGQKIDEKSARNAGDLTLVKARPMSQNAYKVDIAKNLIARAVLSLASA